MAQINRLTPARHSKEPPPEEDDSEPAAEDPKGRCCEIHKCRVPAGRKVLETLQDGGYSQKQPIIRAAPPLTPPATATAADPA